MSATTQQSPQRPRAEERLGDLVLERPSRTQVLSRLGIDWCCGGQRTLAEACRWKGLQLEAVIAELAAVEAGPFHGLAPNPRSIGEVCDHITEVHHELLRRELPRLGRLVDRLAADEGRLRPDLVQLQRIFPGLVAEILLHLQAEEEALFPALRALDHCDCTPPGCHVCDVEAPIRFLRFEHDQAIRALERMRELTGGFAPPSGASPAHCDLLLGLAALEADLQLHVHEENNLLFPMAREAGSGRLLQG